MERPRWKVGGTQSTMPPAHEMLDDAYGFSIQDRHGAPLLTISFSTKAESERAEAAVRKAIENAIQISLHGR